MPKVTIQSFEVNETFINLLDWEIYNILQSSGPKTLQELVSRTQEPTTTVFSAIGRLMIRKLVISNPDHQSVRFEADQT